MSYVFAVYAGLFVLGALLPPMRVIDPMSVAITHAWMGACAAVLSLLALISAIKDAK